jgi:hypothetical protein
MKVELQQHSGIRYDGETVVFDQWQVFATGANGNRVLVGYLSHDEEIPLMLVTNQPVNIVRELVTKCEAITKRTVLPPMEIVEPPEIDNSAGEDDYTDDEEDDQDND